MPKSTIATAPRKRGRPPKNTMQLEPQPSTSSGRKSKSRKKQWSDSDEDLDNMCCVCSEMTENRADEKQCILCKRRTHDRCVRLSDSVFTCLNCFSDIDDEEEN